MTLISCDDEEGYEEYKIIDTEMKDLSGDWYVKLYLDGAELTDYARITTSNTADNTNSAIQINDHLNIWYFNVQANANYQEKTFSGDALPSSVDDDDDPSTPDYEVDVTITDGKVLYDATMTSAGQVADSIYFEVEFSDDTVPGTVYEIAGFRRNGLLADEH